MTSKLYSLKYITIGLYSLLAVLNTIFHNSLFLIYILL